MKLFIIVSQNNNAQSAGDLYHPVPKGIYVIVMTFYKATYHIN